MCLLEYGAQTAQAHIHTVRKKKITHAHTQRTYASLKGKRERKRGGVGAGEGIICIYQSNPIYTHINKYIFD